MPAADVSPQAHARLPRAAERRIYFPRRRWRVSDRQQGQSQLGTAQVGLEQFDQVDTWFTEWHADRMKNDDLPQDFFTKICTFCIDN